MSIRNLCAAILALATIGGGASQAATYGATTIVDGETSYGACLAANPAVCKANDRMTVTNVLGETDGKFYSLGLGGELVLGFAASFFAPGATVTFNEVTFGGAQASRHFEALDVYAVAGSVATLVDTVYNTTKTTTLTIMQGFDHLRLVDVTLREYAVTTSTDGFDIDSVTVMAAVPVPLGGILLLSGLGGMLMVRRRQPAA